MLFKLLRGRSSAHRAIWSAFLLCAMYFVTWYLISHLSNFPGSLIL
ncbi:hypothetical protein L1274_001029 [Duganella sp. HSC-15S17]|uniref:Tripartite tricarboxylate transporter TctB family protein n=1 Tax=Duganella violaceipulchra TaxID=2849652 RepID=A0ABT1GEE9_9BURK|nr:hypothetical protein [Duganella violaceicalia]